MLATRVSSANGLRTSSLARSGRETGSALSTITGMRRSDLSAVNTCSTSQPDTRGIIKSRITRSAPGGSLRVRKSIACLPLAAGITSIPSLSSRSCNVSRTSRSSSTSRTLFEAIGATLPPRNVGSESRGIKGRPHGNLGDFGIVPMSPSSRYTILRKIADGGTAEIFLAKQHGAHGFEKTVVLKRIFTTFYADPQFRHMLVDEAHVAMTLNHSNIVQVLDLGESEGRYFLALELVDGWTLDRVLRRSKAAGVPAPPALALYITAEVCRALAYAHGKKRSDGKPLGIIHRDISPHNVLLSEQGEVKLTDFGIAKAQTRKDNSTGKLIKGKIAFMSPEQASGQSLDARSDLFSVG